MSEFNFFLLVFSTICIAAAGYAINDYFDTKTDILNHPDEVIVGKVISRRVTIFIHTILNFLGILTGIYVSFKIGKPILSCCFILITGILWFYSTTYKRQFLLGNLIVAFLTALVPFTVALFEVPLLYKEYGSTLIIFKANFNYILAWIGGFSVFAFLANLLREIIKDVEDFEGDSAFGCNTLPIVIGIKYTKLIIYALILFTIILMVYVYFSYLSINFSGNRDYISMIYIFLLLIVPLIYLSWKIYVSREKKDYHIASNITKFIMIAGISYAFVVDFILWSQNHAN